MESSLLDSALAPYCESFRRKSEFRRALIQVPNTGRIPLPQKTILAVTKANNQPNQNILTIMR